METTPATCHVAMARIVNGRATAPEPARNEIAPLPELPGLTELADSTSNTGQNAEPPGEQAAAVAAPVGYAGTCEPGLLPRTLYNRLEAVLSHIPWYSFKTQARLARDSRVSKAAISRLVRGECQPSLTVALQVTKAIEQRLGRPLDVWELFSLDGSYPTASVCELMGCRSCLPAVFYDAQERLKPEFRQAQAGHWSISQPYHGRREVAAEATMKRLDKEMPPAMVRVRDGRVVDGEAR